MDLMLYNCIAHFRQNYIIPRSSCVSAYQCSTTAITCQYPFSNTNILTFLATYPMLKNRYPPTYFRNMPSLWPNGQGKLSVALTQVWYSTTFVRLSACVLDPSNFGRIRYHVLLAALSGVVIPDQGVKPSEALSGCSARGAPRNGSQPPTIRHRQILGHYFCLKHKEKYFSASPYHAAHAKIFRNLVSNSLRNFVIAL